MGDCISALLKIKFGNAGLITDMEGEAMATLWHEVTHNRHKGLDFAIGNMANQAKECANEWVSRHTLNEFYDRLGVKHKTRSMLKYMSHNEVLDYDAMVTNYDHIIQICGLDRKNVFDSVCKGLFNDEYNDQYNVLINGLIKGGMRHVDGSKVSYGTATHLVRYAIGQASKEEITNLAEKLMIQKK